MNIYELKDSEMNLALAYAMGLIYPLYREKEYGGKEYILGCVNHNKVTEEDLFEHFKSVTDLFSLQMEDRAPMIKANKSDVGTLSSKKGFTVLIEKNDVDKKECLDILTKKVGEIQNSTPDIKREFVKGCFDGRASWDKTTRYIAVDVDRDYDRQKLIIDIIKSINIDLNVNNRDINHKKNDQIRIQPSFAEKYMREIGFYSVCRRDIIESSLKNK